MMKNKINKLVATGVVAAVSMAFGNSESVTGSENYQSKTVHIPLGATVSGEVYAIADMWLAYAYSEISGPQVFISADAAYGDVFDDGSGQSPSDYMEDYDSFYGASGGTYQMYADGFDGGYSYADLWW